MSKELIGSHSVHETLMRQTQIDAARCDQLRAQINVLRELVIHSTDYRLGNPAYEASIATTPEQSLAEYRNKVIEDCAVLCEKSDRYRGAYFAEKLRAMKEPE